MQKRFGDGVKKGQPGFRGLPSYLKAKLYLFQLKTRSLYIAAVGSNHYMELAGFVYILYVVVVELQQFGGNGEGHLLAFAFFQVDALEAFQLFHAPPRNMENRPMGSTCAGWRKVKSCMKTRRGNGRAAGGQMMTTRSFTPLIEPLLIFSEVFL